MRSILVGIVALTALFSTAAHAQMICITSQNGNGSRLVPARYGSCGGANISLLALPVIPFEVPDREDNGDPRPRAFRIAYFYPDRTEAYYTSCSGTGMPTIKYVGAVQVCRRLNVPQTR